MKKLFLYPSVLLILVIPACAPMGSIARHEFESGYYSLKSDKANTPKVFVDVFEDSLVVYQMKPGTSEIPDTESGSGTRLSAINSDSYLFRNKFIKNSIEFDLSTILTKLRFASSGVPVQLNANLNALIYMGARKDYYVIKSIKSPLNRYNTSIEQIGYDFGVFAGIGITPINPSVTNGNTSLEYDGIVFQKGIGAFITINSLSVGITMGFDNLMSNDSKFWIYNNRPYLGLTLGIANF